MHELVNYYDYNEMHGQKNIKIIMLSVYMLTIVLFAVFDEINGYNIFIPASFIFGTRNSLKMAQTYRNT